MTFEEQKFLFLIKSYLSAFSLMAHAFVHLGNLYLNKRPKDVSPVFFQKCFSFSSSSMIRFKLIFYMTKDMSRGVFFFLSKSAAHMYESTSELSLQPDWSLPLFLCHSFTILILLLYSKSHNQCMSSNFYSFTPTFFWLFCSSI